MLFLDHHHSTHAGTENFQPIEHVSQAGIDAYFNDPSFMLCGYRQHAVSVRGTSEMDNNCALVFMDQRYLLTALPNRLSGLNTFWYSRGALLRK